MKPKVKFKIMYGFGKEFLNFLLQKGYILNDITSIEMGYIAVCDAHDYKEISKYSRKFQCRIKIIEKQGAYFRYGKYLKRKGIAAGAAVAVLLCFLFTKIVWRINITAADRQMKSRVATELFENGVYPGVFFDNIKMKNLKNKMMRENEGISYIAFNFYKGVLECLVYPVTDRENYTEIQSENNICALLSGVITDLRVYSGFSQVQPGQSVSRGDILVSNINTSKYDYTSTSDTAAYIEGICKKEYSIYVPFSNSATALTGEYIQNRYLYFMGKEYKLGRYTETDTQDVSVRSKIQPVNIMGFRFPATIKTVIYYKTAHIESYNEVLDTYAKAKNRMISIISDDIKLKKELSREYSYKFGDEGVTCNCIVEGYYIMI